MPLVLSFTLLAAAGFGRKSLLPVIGGDSRLQVIALSQTLTTQLELLNSWLPHLATLPMPPALKHKISDRISSLSEIANEKSQLLQSAATLLSQEQQLRRDASELQNLKHKVKEIRTHLSTHYQSDQELARLLPVERQKVDTLIGNIQQNLAELDQELANGQSENERSQQKTTLTF